MPIHLYAEFNKYLVQDAGIGSDGPSLNTRFSTLFQFVANGMMDEANTECYNLFSNAYLQVNKISIKDLSFACFIESINGEELTDYSEDNLIKVCQDLGRMGLTRGMVDDILQDLKKNWIRN